MTRHSGAIICRPPRSDSAKMRNISRFPLYTREDFKFFQDTMEQKIAGFHWSSAEARLMVTKEKKTRKNQ